VEIMKKLNITIEHISREGKLKSELVSALRAVLAAQAFLETIKPVSAEIYKEAIEIYKPVVEAKGHYVKSKRFQSEIGKPITCQERIYQADDATTNKIYKYHKSKLAEKGFTAEKNFCPVLVAESVLREAQTILIDLMEPYTNIPDDLLYLPDKRARYLEIVLKMLVTVAKQQNIQLHLINLN